MKMFTFAANNVREINDFVNDNGIPQENIVSVFPTPEGVYMLIYYSED